MANRKAFVKTALHEIQITLDESDYEMAQGQWESFVMELQQMDESQEEVDE
jgi:hypothetical protein